MGKKATKHQTKREKRSLALNETKKRLETYASYDEPPKPAHEVPRLEAKNYNQKRAIGLLSTGVQVVLLTGSAGTGKSLIAVHRAASLLKSKKIDKIWLTRPAVTVGKSVGLLPGEVKEKLLPYFRQTLAHLEKFLGKGYLTYCLEKGIIEMQPVEYLRGMSFEDCFVLLEEGQNFDHDEFEMMLTRLGDGSQLCVTGDCKQNDLRQVSGLKTTVALINKMLQTHPEYLSHEDIDMLDEAIGVVEFQPEDVVRSGLTRALVKMYYHND